MRARFCNSRVMLALLMVLAMIVFAGGCGGSGSSSGGGASAAREKLYVLGEMHGDLSDEIAELIDGTAFTGSERDAPLLISYEDGFDIDDDTAAAARELLEAGYAIGVEHASEAEINELLEALGFEGGFVMPTGYTYVEFYGIKMTEDGDVFAYVTLNDDENLPLELLTSPDSYMIREGVIVSSDFETTAEFTEDNLALLAEYGLTVSGDDIMSGDRVITSADVISGDTVLSADGTWVPYDFDISDIPPAGIGAEELAEAEMTLAESIVEWLYSSDGQAEAARRSKEDIRRDLPARGENDLTKIASMYQRTYDASIRNQTFKIIVEVYGCHSFNTADGTENDWFIVKQTGQLNPSGNYSKKPHSGLYSAKIEGYMVYYSFDNYLVDSSGNFINTGVALQQPKPETSVGSSGISSSVAFNFGGNVGFSGGNATGGISMGASYSSSESHTVADCMATNESLATVNGAVQQRAKWRYSFTRPWCNGWKFFGCNDFEDAPAASRALFQPVQQWAWKIDNSQRDNVKGFKFKFKWQNGYSFGEGYAWGVKADKIKHHDWSSNETEFYVPFDAIYPPLIAGNRLDFPKKADYKKLTMATCRNWTAASDKSWCQLSRTSGGKDDIDDVFVTVDENTTGQNREAYITLKTTDGKGTFKVKIFQAKN